MSGKVAKIERVSAPAIGSRLWVDLLLNKGTGKFFAMVGGERYEASTKEEAVKMVKDALAAVTKVVWREVILIRVNEERVADEDEYGSTENGKRVLSASCDFTYMRRERALNPLDPKETIERAHREDFEREVAKARARVLHYSFSYDKAGLKKRADEEEAQLREDRAALAHVGPCWTHFGDKTKEYELPYSTEAWAGIQRIAQALRDTQKRLDEFASIATPEKLAQMAAGDALRLLPEPQKKKEKRERVTS